MYSSTCLGNSGCNRVHITQSNRSAGKYSFQKQTYCICTMLCSFTSVKTAKNNVDAESVLFLVIATSFQAKVPSLMQSFLSNLASLPVN